jgi:hypothetical protein
MQPEHRPEQSTDPLVRNTAFLVQRGRQRDQPRSELHSGGPGRVGNLLRMPIPNRATAFHTPRNIDAKLRRHWFDGRNVRLPLSLSMRKLRRSLAIDAIQGRRYFHDSVDPLRQRTTRSLTVPLPCLSSASLWMALRFSSREWRRLAFCCLLKLLNLSTQPIVLFFQLIDAPIALIDPAVPLRDLLFQVRDALLLFFSPTHPASVYSYEGGKQLLDYSVQ